MVVMGFLLGFVLHIWLIGLIAFGCLFGNMPWTKANMSLIIWLTILMPGAIALLGAWQARRRSLQAERDAAAARAGCGSEASRCRVRTRPRYPRAPLLARRGSASCAGPTRAGCHA